MSKWAKGDYVHGFKMKSKTDNLLCSLKTQCIFHSSSHGIVKQSDHTLIHKHIPKGAFSNKSLKDNEKIKEMGFLPTKLIILQATPLDNSEQNPSLNCRLPRKYQF